MISKEGLLTIGRFFAALYQLKNDGAIRGVQTFTRRYGINRRNLYTLERNIEERYGIFDIGWLAHLVHDYGVSADWLLTGTGAIYGEKAQKQRKRETADE
jgi:hypothetical protein